MPKRISNRPSDVNQAAFLQVQRSTSESALPQADADTPSRPERPRKATKAEISRVMATMGRKGGKIGGKRRLETMTPEERKTRAQRAAKAR